MAADELVARSALHVAAEPAMQAVSVSIWAMLATAVLHGLLHGWQDGPRAAFGLVGSLLSTGVLATCLVLPLLAVVAVLTGLAVRTSVPDALAGGVTDGASLLLALLPLVGVMLGYPGRWSELQIVLPLVRLVAVVTPLRIGFRMAVAEGVDWRRGVVALGWGAGAAMVGLLAIDVVLVPASGL